MALPQYKFDPVTQTYTLVQPEVAPSQSRGLYDLSGDADNVSGFDPENMYGNPEIGVGLQNFGQRAQNATLMDVVTSPGLTAASAISGLVGNAMMGSQVTPVTLTDPTVTAIAPAPAGLAGLTAMNQAQAAPSQNAPATAQESVAQAVADFADMADAEAGQAVADAAAAAAASAATGVGGGDSVSTDGGDSSSTDSGGMDQGDSTNAGDSDSDTYYKGGSVMNYQGGGYATPRPYIYNQPTMMAEGGLAAAKRTQDAGRGPDTMLVHMAPQEVAGLQALAMAHGGSLTINPKTGLPEAGFLSSLLPTLVGAALTVGSGGAISPFMAAGLVGGGTALATGSLKKGLFAGLGAFGGANIGAGLSAAGAGTAENLMAPAAEATMATPLEIAQTNIDPGLLEAGMSAEQVMTQGLAGSPTAQGAVLSAGQYAPTINVMDVANQRVIPSTIQPGLPAQPVTPQGIMPRFEQAGTGLKNVFSSGPTGEAARSAFGKEAGMGSFSAALAPLSTVEPEPIPTRKAYIRPYDVNVVNRSADVAGLYQPGSTSGREMLSYEFTPRPIYEAAGGGLMALKAGGMPKKSKKLGGDPYYKFSDSRKDTSMEAALDANFAKGGGPRYLNGEGDGMSDDIPAMIDGKQPARLADGEFVVPADVVSHLGNGSSKAGAKKLYSMMDRIRKARTGKKSQAPAVKSERYMPA